MLQNILIATAKQRFLFFNLIYFLFFVYACIYLLCINVNCNMKYDNISHKN